MLERAQRIGVAPGEKVEPRACLPGIAKKGRKEAVESHRDPAGEERYEPGDGKDEHGEHAPNAYHDVMRNEENRSKEDGDASPSQRLVVPHPDSSLVHPRRYGTPVRRASLLLLVTVVLAGCGGGGGNKRLSREQYASKADSICKKYNQQAKSLANPSNLPQLANVADKTLPILDNALRDLRRLKPPADEQATAEKWLEQVENLKGDLQEIRDKAKSKDLQGVQAVVPKAQQHNTRGNRLATQLGMKVCNTG
jgi:hypothetical protein